MKLKVIIVEDEPLAADLISEYVQEVSYLQLMGVFQSPGVALDYVKKMKTDVIFLDIHLPEMTGLEFISSLPNDPQVILTTAYHQYAIQGYEYNVVDYLLKPIELDRFLVAVNKLRRYRDINYLLISVNKVKYKISFHEIRYVESNRDYLRIFLINGQVRQTRMTISAVNGMLSSDFIRVHRSYIVNKNYVTSLNSSSLYLGQQEIKIGRKYKDNLIDVFG